MPPRRNIVQLKEGGVRVPPVRKKKVTPKKAKQQAAKAIEDAALDVTRFTRKSSKAAAGRTKKPKVQQIKKIAAVSIARSGEQQARKLPVSKRPTRVQGAAVRDAVRDTGTTGLRNRKLNADEAIRIINARAAIHRAASSDKDARKQVTKRAFKDAMAETAAGVTSLGTNKLSDKLRQEIASDAKGSIKKLKKLGPFAVKQAEREGLVKRNEIGEILSRSTKTQDGISRAATPVVTTLLDVASRPFYAASAAADAASKGEDVGKAAKRGVQGKQQSSYRDVAKNLGAPKIVADVVGTGADFVLDPLNAVSFGTASAARKAGQDAARKAVKAGASQEAVRKAQVTAMRAAESASSANTRKGLVVRVAGKDVEPVRRVTAKAVDKGAKRVEKSARLTRMAETRNTTARQVRPKLKPRGVSESDWMLTRDAAREARATEGTMRAVSDRRSKSLERAVAKHFPQKADRVALVDAVERLDFAKLNPKQEVVARRLADDFDALQVARASVGLKRDVRKKAATIEGAPKGYFPHVRADTLRESKSQRVDFGNGGTVMGKKVTDKRREDNRTLAVKNAEREAEMAATGKERPLFEVDDVALVRGASGEQTARKVARAQFIQRVSSDAPRVTPGEMVGKGEAVFRLKNGEIEKVAGFGDDTTKLKGNLIRVNEDAFQAMEETLQTVNRGRATEGWDRLNAGWKRLALATPGFYVRNAIGDGMMAFHGARTAKETVAVAKASADIGRKKVMKRARETSRDDLQYFNPDTVRPEPSQVKMKVAGKPMPLDSFLDLARKTGVMGSGQQSREVAEMRSKAKGRGNNDVMTGVKGGKAGLPRDAARRGVQRVTDAGDSVQDFWRVVTFKAMLDRGMSVDDAARRAMDVHIDYGELSQFEKQARRVLPFWTFNNKGLQNYAGWAASRPRILSQFEKARESASDLTGADEETEDKRTAEYQERQAPFIVNVNGEELGLSAGFPITVLNEIPINFVKGAPQEDLKELGTYMAGLLSPFVKVPGEMITGSSAFFRAPIENSDAPLVAAPSYLKVLLDTPLADAIDLQYFTDKTGKKVLGYRGTADYLLKAAMPGAPGIANALVTDGANRRGVSGNVKAASAISGIKVDALDERAELNKSISQLYKEREKWRRKRGMAKQAEDESAYGTASDRYNELTKLIDELTDERGDVKRERKTLKKKGSGFSWSGSGSSGGGSSSPSSPSGGSFSWSK